MKRIILLIILLLFVIACGRKEEDIDTLTKQVVYEGYGYTEKDVVKAYSENTWCYLPTEVISFSGTSFLSQEIRIEIFNEVADTYEEAKNNGYCFDVEYVPDKTTNKYKEKYTDHRWNYGHNYEQISFNVPRFSDTDKIIITVNGESTVYEFGSNSCGPWRKFIHYFDLPIKEERYDCLFRGELKSRNLTYKELEAKGASCDSYKIYCGE